MSRLKTIYLWMRRRGLIFPWFHNWVLLAYNFGKTFKNATHGSRDLNLIRMTVSELKQEIVHTENQIREINAKLEGISASSDAKARCFSKWTLAALEGKALREPK